MAEKFVPKSNGLDVRLFWFVMALISGWDPIDKMSCFMRLLTSNHVDFGPVYIK